MKDESHLAPSEKLLKKVQVNPRTPTTETKVREVTFRALQAKLPTFLEVETKKATQPDAGRKMSTTDFWWVIKYTTRIGRRFKSMLAQEAQHNVVLMLRNSSPLGNGEIKTKMSTNLFKCLLQFPIQKVKYLITIITNSRSTEVLWKIVRAIKTQVQLLVLKRS